MGKNHKAASVAIVILGIVAALAAAERAGAMEHAFAEPQGVLLYGPKPDYSWEARSRGQAGTCVAALTLDPAGHVSELKIVQSTGYPMLDRAVSDRLKEWRFKPNTPSPVKIPIVFDPGGDVITLAKVKEAKSMDDVLAGFLGKGTVLDGPIPQYPTSPPWTEKQGKGVYEMHVGNDGKVAEVRILKASGDATFDRVTVNTLRKWRLRTGPKVIELPLAFKLTPRSYDVRIP
jgi:TonB family protein